MGFSTGGNNGRLLGDNGPKTANNILNDKMQHISSVLVTQNIYQSLKYSEQYTKYKSFQNNSTVINLILLTLLLWCKKEQTACTIQSVIPERNLSATTFLIREINQRTVNKVGTYMLHGNQSSVALLFHSTFLLPLIIH